MGAGFNQLKNFQTLNASPSMDLDFIKQFRKGESVLYILIIAETRVI